MKSPSPHRLLAASPPPLRPPRALVPLLLAGALLLGCKGDDTADKDTGDIDTDTDSPYVYQDTSEWVDTSTPQETGDTGDTSMPVDTGEPDDTVAALHLHPADFTAGVGATYALRLVSEDVEGELADVDASEFDVTTSDHTVAIVGGTALVKVMGEGEATLTASWKGHEATATLTATDGNTLELTLLDAETGLPVENGSASLGDDDRTSADEDGRVTLTPSDSGGVWVNAWAKNYIPITIADTVSRDLTVPLRSRCSAEESVTFAGDSDFSSVDEGSVYEDLSIGLAVASFRHGPLFFDVESLVGEDRTVSIYGVSATIPSNIFVKDMVPDYEGATTPGDFDVWSMAGPVPITDLTSGLNGSGDVLGLLEDNLARFSFGWSGTYTAGEDETVTVDVAPDTPYEEEVTVQIPMLSSGFSGDEEALVLVVDETTSGLHSVTGLGLGTGTVTARRAPTSAVSDVERTHALVIAQADGIGSGEAMAYAAAEVESDGTAMPPDFQDLPSITSFSGSTREYSTSTDADVTLVRITIEGGEGSLRDLVLAGGSQSGTLPAPPYSFSYGKTTWSLQAFETTTGTFESLASTGTVYDEALADHLVNATSVGQTFSGK